MRPTLHEYFFGIAKTVAARSTCLRVPDGIGAVIVKDKHILATGYVGSIKGQPHCEDVGCLIDPKVGGCIRTVHAEINAILQAASHGVTLQGATIYTTMSPCLSCFKAIVNAGITSIRYWTEYRTVDPQKEWARNCGVEFIHHSTDIYHPQTVPQGVSMEDVHSIRDKIRAYILRCDLDGETYKKFALSFISDAFVFTPLSVITPAKHKMLTDLVSHIMATTSFTIADLDEIKPMLEREGFELMPLNPSDPEKEIEKGV